MENYTIKLSDGIEVNASEYQNKIFNNIEFGTGNMIINAAAGSAKTTTIVNALRYISDDKKVLFVAFNTEIVKTIKGKIDRLNTNITTFHALGRSILIENNKYPKDKEPFEFKYQNYIKNNIETLSSKYVTIDKKFRHTYISNIIHLSEYCRYYLAMTKKEITRIANLYNIKPIADEIDVCRTVLIWGKDNIDVIDYTDMIWLPNVLNLQTKFNLYDWIFIDEAQDTSITEQHIIDRCFKRGTRFVAVGDEAQQINTWCGSTKEAIDLFRKKPNTKDYFLTISYRCPKKIIELAQKYGRIECADNAIDGEIRYDVSANDAQDGDLILCRITSPLIDQYLKFLRLNKRVYIRGFENIRNDYLDLINSVPSKLIDNNCLTSDGLIPSLYKKVFSEVEYAMKKYNIDEEDALSINSIIKIYDDIEGIKVISEGLYTVEELKNKINMIFNLDDIDERGIILSTVHRAKGLEFDNVFILRPSLMPSKFALKEWEKKAEQNLIYVAYTRAKKSLNFIKEWRSDAWTLGNYNFNAMREALIKYKEKIMYNTELDIKETVLKPHMSATSAKTLGSKIVFSTTNEKKQKVKGGLKFFTLTEN